MRLDWFYLPDGDSHIGVSFYVGDSADNRPKPGLDVSAVVMVMDGHPTYERGPVRARALVLYGHLQNAEAITEANRNLSNNPRWERTAYTGGLNWHVLDEVIIQSIPGARSRHRGDDGGSCSDAGGGRRGLRTARGWESQVGRA